MTGQDSSKTRWISAAARFLPSWTPARERSDDSRGWGRHLGANLVRHWWSFRRRAAAWSGMVFARSFFSARSSLRLYNSMWSSS